MQTFRIVFWVAIVLAAVVIVGAVASCTEVYKLMGMTEAEATTQSAKDTKEVVSVIEQTRGLFWPIIQSIIAGLAIVLATKARSLLEQEKADRATLGEAIRTADSKKTVAALIKQVEKTGNGQRIAVKTGIPIPKGK